MKIKADEKVLKIRGGLGMWRHVDGSWCLLAEKDALYNLDPYMVTTFSKPYNPPMNFGTDEKDILSRIDKLRIASYKLVEPKFPELQEFFRDGEPITEAMLFQDDFNSIKADPNALTGFEALIASRK